MKKIIWTILFSIIIFGCNNKTMKKPESLIIKIIQTTDIHGAIFPEDLINQTKRIGSMAQVLTFVKQERKNSNQEVILLDNGDILQGDPTVYYYNFENTDSTHLLAEVMNYMNYDAGTIGNHDIETGHDVYDKFRKEINFDWLAANAVNIADSSPYFKPYTIIERQGVKIAVLGLITPAIPNWLPENIWSGMHFEDMIESAKKWVKIIQEKENPDILIGLFHSGINASYGNGDPNAPFNENAVKLVAEQVAGFDIIFGGHDHRFSNFNVVNQNGDTAIIMNPRAFAGNAAVAELQLVLNKNTSKYKIKTDCRIVSMEDYKPDSNFIYKFNIRHQEVKKYVYKPIGRLMNDIDASKALFGPSAFVDLVHKVQLEISGADISLASPFSISAHLDTGMLFVRDMFKLYRFENYLYVMELSGEEIHNALEYSYNLWINTMKTENDLMLKVQLDENGRTTTNNFGKAQLQNPYYNFDSGGGIEYIVDLRKENGNRVKITSLADGSPFDYQKKYKVAMNSYRGNGGGNILISGAGLTKDELKKRLLSSTEVDFRLIFKNWIEKNKKIYAKPSNNWKFIPEKWAERGKSNFLVINY